MDFSRDHCPLFFSNRLQMRGKCTKELARLLYFFFGPFALGDLAINAQDALNSAPRIEFRVNAPIKDRESVRTFEFKLSFKGLFCSKDISNCILYEGGLISGKSNFNRSFSNKIIQVQS